MVLSGSLPVLHPSVACPFSCFYAPNMWEVWISFLRLVHQLAAVDLDDLTYQVVRRRRSEERDDSGRLLGGALTSHGDGVLQVLAYVGGREPVVEWSGYHARCNTVHEDV